MVVAGVLTSGHWVYPIQGLVCYGGAEEKKPSHMLFNSRQVYEASGVIGPIYLSEAYLYRDLDHDQDGVETEVPKTFSFIFPNEDWKYSEKEFAGIAKPNI